MERHAEPARTTTADPHAQGEPATAAEGARTAFTARGTIPPVVGSGPAHAQPSASDRVYGASTTAAQAKTATGPSPVTRRASARDPLARARIDAQAVHAAPALQRVSMLSHMLESDIDTLVYQAALAAACADVWSQVKAHAPAGVDVGAIESGAREIAPAQRAATSYDAHWMNRDRVYAEVYIATYIAHHGAKDVARQLTHLMPGAPARSLAGHLLGYAERDGLVTAADAIAAADPTAMTWRGAPADDIEHALVGTLGADMNAARKQFDAAQAALQALDDKLQLELHEIGPALYDPHETDPKKVDDANRRVKAYIHAYQASPEYVKARAASSAAARHLGHEATAVGDDLLAHGRVHGSDKSSTEARTSVLDTYEGLAGSEAGALSAVTWAQSHLADPHLATNERARVQAISALGQATDATFKLQRIQQMMQTASALPTEAERTKGLAAVADFVQANVCTPYGQVNNLKGMTQLGEKVRALKANTGIVHALASHDAMAAARIAEEFVAHAPADSATIVKRVWSGLGSLIGVFNGSRSLAHPTDPLNAFNTAKSLNDNLLALKALIGGAAEVSEAGHRAKAFALVEQIHGGFVDLKTAGFGVLGLASSVMAIEHEWSVAKAHPDNVALQVQLAADIASAVGSALCMVPALAPLGELISICGSVVSMTAGFFVGDVEGNDRRKQERQILSQPGIMPGSPQTGPVGPKQLALAETFTTPEAADNLAAAQEAGLTLTQICELGRSRAFLFEKRTLIQSVDSLRRYAARHPEYGHYANMPTLYQLLSTGMKAGLEEIASEVGVSNAALLDADKSLLHAQRLCVMLGITAPQYYTARGRT